MPPKTEYRMTMDAAITGTQGAQTLSISKTNVSTLLITLNSRATGVSTFNTPIAATMIRTALPYKSPIASATERLSKNSPIRTAS